MTSPSTEPPTPPAAQVTQPAPDPLDQQQWLQATCEVVVDSVPQVVRDQAQCEGLYTNLLSNMVWVLPSTALALALLFARLVRRRRNQPRSAATDPSTAITDTPTPARRCLTVRLGSRRRERRYAKDLARHHADLSVLHRALPLRLADIYVGLRIERPN